MKLALALTLLVTPVMLLSPTVLVAQEENDGQERAEEPAWLSYQRGIALYRDGQYGRALELFRRAIATGSPFPEAEVGVGMVFEAEGSYDLAIRQYETALENRQFFRIEEEAYAVLYQLAEIHDLQADYPAFQRRLNEIVADDELFTQDQYENLRSSYRRTLSREGLNRLIVLYRQENQFALRAHRELGAFYVRSGRYEEAVDHLLFATLKTLSVAISALREEIFEYEFTTIEQFLIDIEGHSRIEEYIDHTELYRTLYFLAGGIYGADRTSDEWQRIWSLLAQTDEAGQWQERASQQLQNPNVEPDIEAGLSTRWTESSYAALASTISRTSMSNYPVTPSLSFPD
jgi:tetratricopeptide (TPR) repeat protein